MDSFNIAAKKEPVIQGLSLKCTTKTGCSWIFQSIVGYQQSDKIPENTDLENLGNDYHFVRHRGTMLSAVSRKLIVATLMVAIMMFPGCIGADEESDEGLGALPDFQGVADNGENVLKV